MLYLLAQRVGEPACIRRCMAALLLQHLQVCPAFMHSMLVSWMWESPSCMETAEFLSKMDSNFALKWDGELQ